MDKSKVILITGSSAGFGELIVNTLLDNGYKNVAATMRNTNGRNKSKAEALKAKGARIYEIDVTDEASIEKAVKQVNDELGGVDVLINNAGAGTLGLQETFSIDDWKKVFDLNVFGVQRMNRAVLPNMRKNQSGLLIHISSLLGRFVIPFLGPYNATKHAVEAMADNYRVELSGLGIESVLVEPGAFGTGFGTNSFQASDKTRAESYGEFAQAPIKMMEGFGEQFKGPDAPSPQMVADAVLKVIEAPVGERPFRTVVDGIGMGQHIEKLNEASEATTRGIYESMGMGQMLKLQLQEA